MSAKKKVVAKATPRVRAKTITIKIGRFGSEPESIVVTAPASVEKVLAKAGIEVSASENIWVNGKRAAMETPVGSGDIVSVISPKEAGSN